MWKPAISAFLLFAALPAWASEPGQPLDCSDWVFVEPGFSCTPVLPRIVPSGSTCDPNNDGGWCHDGSRISLDNDGYMMRLRVVPIQPPMSCGGEWANEQIELVRFNLSARVETVIGYYSERCGAPGTVDGFSDSASMVRPVMLDEERGHLYFSLYSTCYGPDGACLYSRLGWPWMGRIEGFTSTFEIMQTYTPTADNIGFRVPLMPEGLPAADSFDTYWGDLATVGDWSEAQGLQCDYPTETPSVGDYLTVADTLPTPSPGSGYYYVTAVTHRGQVRYGRKQVGGVTSGRDPAVLPGCE